MSTTTSTTPDHLDNVHHRRRWLALTVISAASLMVVLDASVVNIALPRAQEALGLTDGNRQWVVTAYALTFGGLLLLGGRVADFLGRKRAFLISLIGFAVASATGGAASTDVMLFGARALQGVFASVLAPAALSLVAATFTDHRELARAFGVYGAVQGAGGAIGLILGGVLTELVSWRWCLYINVPIALVTLLVAIPTLRESRADGERRYDVPGALLVTLGAGLLVLGFTNAAEAGGWGATSTLVTIALAAVLLIAFVLVERKVSAPLLPMRLVWHRNRGGAFALSSLVGAGMFGMLLFLAYYLQVDLGMTPLTAGLAFLPFSAGIIVTAMAASALLPTLGAKTLLVGGAAIATVGMLLLSRIDEQSTWLTGVLPGEVIVSLGLGLVFVPLNAVALTGIDPGDSGVVSAMVNTTQQLGGALGTALLNTVFASVAVGVAAHAGTEPGSALEGYRTVFLVAGGLFALAALIAAILMRRGAVPVS